MSPHHYRLLLVAAATYNLLFFAWTAAFPASFFDWVGLGRADEFHFLWRCIGLLVGCYGIGYYWAARYPREGRVAVAVGLVGKALVPLAWIGTFLAGAIPARTFVVVLVTDIIWLPAFLALTLAASGRQRLWNRSVFWISVAAYTIASVLLTRIGTGSARSIVPWVALGWVAFSVAAVFSLPLVSLLFSTYSHAFRESGTQLILRIAIIVAAVAYLVASTVNVVAHTSPSPQTGLAFDGSRVTLGALAIGNALAFLVHGTAFGIIWRARRAVPTLLLLCLLLWVPALGLCLVTIGFRSPPVMLVSAIPTFVLVSSSYAAHGNEPISSGFHVCG